VLKGHEQQVNGARFSSDDSLLFTYSDDGTVRAWDFNGAKQLAMVGAQITSINSIDLSFDDSRLAAGSWSEIAIWDVARESRSPQIIADMLRCKTRWMFDERSGALRPATLDAAHCQ
jgi:WD40 repeat protein